MKTELIFDSKRVPGSVVVKTPNGRAQGMLVVISRDTKLAKKGQHYFISIGDQMPAYNLIPPGTYEEVKAAVIKIYEDSKPTASS